MISSKKLPGLAAWLLVLALAAAFFVPAALGARGGTAMAYEETLFGQELLSVDIVMDEADWDSLLQNAASEEYQSATVVINNEKYANVGIRAKGNTSLSTVASMDSDRYSFKIKFDAYSAGKTCDGLSMLVLNNLMGDATYLKEYLTYDMFHYLEADASLFTMARVTVNGEPWGIYLALEQVDEKMLLREYGSVGELYKPDAMNMGGGGAPDFGGEMPDFEAMREQFEAQVQDGGTEPSERMGGRGGERGGFGMSGGGSDLNYTDDSLDSYSTIWDGAKTDSTDSDHQRVVKALKGISGGDLETYMDVDNMLRYMAVQTFVVNLDSLTGSMAHNYYLYEDDGKLNLIPWDYNLALGGFQSGSASGTINFPIDTPFTSSMEDRQFFAALLENEAYLAQYHEYLRMLCEEYVGTVFPQTYASMRLLLDDLVASEEADPTAFYTNEEYLEAVETLKTTVELRAQSILGQLDGTIPSTSDGQDAEPDKLIDCSDIDLSVMGSQFEGGSFGGGISKHGGTSKHGENIGSPRKDTSSAIASPDSPLPDRSAAQGSIGSPAEQNGRDEATAPPRDNADSQLAPDASAQRGGGWQPENGGRMPEGMAFPGASQSNTNSLTANLAVTAGALALLVLAMVFTRLYHRRKFRTK